MWVQCWLVCREVWSATYSDVVKETHAGHHAASAAAARPQRRCFSAGQGDHEAGEHAPATRLAQAVQQLVDRASRSRSGPQFPHPEWEAPLLLFTNVVRVCCPELLAVKEALLDTRRPISAAVLQLKTFLSHPGASRLFGADPVIVRRAARQLQRSFAEHPEP